MAYVQIYTGDGKGKTTAALGLLIRASGAGLRCAVYQFLKCGKYSEIQCLRDRFPEVPIEQFGTGRFISPDDMAKEGLNETERKNLSETLHKAIQKTREGFQKAYDAARDGEYDLIILDEINVAADLGLLPVEDVLRLIKGRSDRTELILTGRGAPKSLIEAADLCTEMRMIKHYYQKGVQARRGIEA